MTLRFLKATFAIALALASAGVFAALSSVLSAGEIEFPGGRVQGFSLAFDSGTSSHAGTVSIETLELSSGETLHDLQLTCERLKLFRTALECVRGSIGIQGKPAAKVKRLSARRSDDDWSAEFALQQLQLEHLQTVWPSLSSSMSGASSSGMADLSLKLQGDDSGVTQAQLNISLGDAALSNPDSSMATEALNATVNIAMLKRGTRFDLNLHAHLRQGYAYVTPILQDYGEFPAKLDARLSWIPARKELQLKSMRWQQPEVLSFNAQGRITPVLETKVQELQIQLDELSLPGAYSQLLEPLLAGTPVDELDTSGRVNGTLHLQQDRPVSLSLTLQDVHLDDRPRRYAVYGLDGVLNWQSDDQSQTSELAWDGFYLGKLPFGPARWNFTARGNQLQSNQPLRVGFFDGSVLLESLQLSGLGETSPQLEFQAALQPVSLPLISSALGMPSFPGTLAGQLPLIQYADQTLSMDGAIHVSAFGGRLSIDKLWINEPLGLVPRLRADIALRNLDLAQLTSVFDFGRVEGQLDIDLNNLELENWLPVAFDARLYTSPGDSSRHRISQRAVNNISRVGGGGAVAALTSGFMRYFENFGYKRIGWSCVLRDGVCQMGGTEAAANENGYVIVQGKGLPRIDVVGHAQRVSWNSLLQQFRAISSGQKPTIN
ncbi:MAG: hypothetical protein ACSHXK_07860 [Oceanococcus sp.]